MCQWNLKKNLTGGIYFKNWGIYFKKWGIFFNLAAMGANALVEFEK